MEERTNQCERQGNAEGKQADTSWSLADDEQAGEDLCDPEFGAWTCAVLEWAYTKGMSPSKLAAELKSRVKNGPIVGHHDVLVGDNDEVWRSIWKDLEDREFAWWVEDVLGWARHRNIPLDSLADELWVRGSPRWKRKSASSRPLDG